jgi:hypothetical protein
VRPIDWRNPSRWQVARHAIEVYWADSIGRRNTLAMRGCDGSKEASTG